jgi:hypothetical protein
MKYSQKSVPVMRADNSEEDRDNANYLKAGMAAEFQQAQSKEAQPTKRRGKQLLKQEFKRGQMEHPAPVENAMEFRRKILSVSLFPNLFNREMVMTHSGVN